MFPVTLLDAVVLEGRDCEQPYVKRSKCVP